MPNDMGLPPRESAARGLLGDTGKMEGRVGELRLFTSVEVLPWAVLLERLVVRIGTAVAGILRSCGKLR